MAKAKTKVTPVAPAAPKREAAPAAPVKSPTPAQPKPDRVASFTAGFESDANLRADKFIEANGDNITVTNRALSGPGDGQQVTVTLNYQGDVSLAD